MQVNILGTRGLPAAHGGFESFVAQQAPYLVARGHAVLVYGQAETGPVGRWRADMWHGVARRTLVTGVRGALGTVAFDWACVRDVRRQPGVDLVLGYNTAVFSLIQRVAGRRVVMNMDGLEWQRPKWSKPVQAWFRVNEAIGLAAAHVPIADHPEIAVHLQGRTSKRVEMIPYGAPRIQATDALTDPGLGLVPDGFFLSVARIEPDNSILEVVRAASAVPGVPLVVLGRLDDDNAYHAAVRAAVGPTVRFLGPVYAPEVVGWLRVHCRAHVHGHQVGGTNPSLVEALGAGSAVIAHDNRFNRWTAGQDQLFFHDVASCQRALERVLHDPARLARARTAARARHAAQFEWAPVLAAYEAVLLAEASTATRRSFRPWRVGRPDCPEERPVRRFASSHRTRTDRDSDASTTRTTN